MGGVTHNNCNSIWIKMYVCTYVYSGGGPQTALAPQPSLIYCASQIWIKILFQ
jgi:hypothetical protein